MNKKIILSKILNYLTHNNKKLLIKLINIKIKFNKIKHKMISSKENSIISFNKINISNNKSEIHNKILDCQLIR